jgi:DNA repair exonuclease SbcCD nuclease subunit
VLKILHTADWHVGRSFGQFEPEDARKLARDRLSVIDKILGLAHQYNVDAVLCAGDLFDTPDPGESWWRGLADSFGRRTDWRRPVVLLPGNHDPLTNGSVYDRSHPFRQAIPEWVRVVDRDDFQLELSNDAVVYAAPCTSTAGDKDLALSLPSRGEGDTRVRIGLVHGSTFDLPNYATNFPISEEAPKARGLDYLALGDTHSFREIPEGAVAPIVYPSAPEPTSFTEHDAGYVALVWFMRHGRRPRIQRERVARWTWRVACHGRGRRR